MARIVVFSGEYDLANKDGLRRELERFETSDGLVFDLTDVTFIDSTFLTELVRLEKGRKVNSLGRLTIVSPEGSAVRRLFNMTGLASIVIFVETCDRDDPGAVIEFAPPGDVLDPTAGTQWTA